MAAKSDKADKPLGTDTVKSVIEISAGVVIDSKLRLSGVKFLERKFGKPFQDLAESFANDQSMTNLSPVLVALYRQRNPNVDDETCELAIDNIAIEDLVSIINKLNIFDFEPKNSQSPAEMETETETIAAAVQ